MASRNSSTSGWPIVGWNTVVILMLTGAILRTRGWTPAGFGMTIGITAMLSTIFFLGAFTASALFTLAPNALTRWQRRNRRYLGMSFVASHTVHGAAIITLVRTTGELPDVLTLVAGGLAYVFIYAMAATSFDATAAALGPKRWKLLHTVGGHYCWFIFVFTYATSPPLDARRLLFIGLLAAGLGVRIVARVRTRQGHPHG